MRVCIWGHTSVTLRTFCSFQGVIFHHEVQKTAQEPSRHTIHWTFMWFTKSQPFNYQVNSLAGARVPLGPWPICSLELLLLGTFAPWTFRFLEHTLPRMNVLGKSGWLAIISALSWLRRVAFICPNLDCTFRFSFQRVFDVLAIIFCTYEGQVLNNGPSYQPAYRVPSLFCLTKGPLQGMQ